MPDSQERLQDSSRDRQPWEHQDAWGKLGPNYGQAKKDEFWDCAHVLASGERQTTLCGRSVADVAQAYSLDSGYKPDDFSGCWTCLEKSYRWAVSPEGHRGSHLRFPGGPIDLKEDAGA